MSAKPNSATLTCTVTVAANDPIGTYDNVSISYQPDEAGVATGVTIPRNQIWVIEDLFITASGDAGTSIPVVQIYKNKSKVMCVTPPINSLLITNTARPPFSRKPLGFNGEDILSAKTITTVANDSIADSVVFYMVVRVL